MKLNTFQYIAKGNKRGWTIDSFPDMDSENTLILLFCSPEFIRDPAPIHELRKLYPRSKMLGCSSAGEIAGPFILDHSISVAILQFEKSEIKVTHKQVASANDSYGAGEYIASILNQDNLRGIFVLSDGLNVNGSELVKGLNTNTVQKNNLIITGGLAADGNDFKRTWTVFNGEIHTDTIVAVGFYGNHVHIGHGSQGGWDIFGPERRITRSKNNILYELDNTPALKLYKKYLGDKATDLPASGLLFPLAIRKPESDIKLVRTILGVDEEEQSLIFAGDMPTGYLAQLMRANFDRIINGASEAGSLAMKHLQKLTQDGKPILLIAISCVGRRLLLGERTEEETEATLENFPEGAEQVGFYSYGELSPFTDGSCDLHNQTMTLTSIMEEN